MYDPADAVRVQAAAAVLAGALAVTWRVLGQDGKPLTVYARQRWQNVAEALPSPAPEPVAFWRKDKNTYPTTPTTLAMKDHK